MSVTSASRNLTQQRILARVGHDAQITNRKHLGELNGRFGVLLSLLQPAAACANDCKGPQMTTDDDFLA
jgi:hypothetical protein